MLQKELEQYKENGFCIISQLLTKKEVKELLEEINTFIVNKSKNLKGREINKVNDSINSIHCLAKEENYFTNLAKTEKIMSLASVLLEDQAELRGAELFAKPAKVGLPSPMHQDNFYWCIAGANGLTIWVALDYCDESNGGLTYYKASHKLGLLEHKDSLAPGSSQMIADSKLLENLAGHKICPSLQPGDCLVHHSLTIHGSSANHSERSRRGFTMQFKAQSATYDRKMLEHYESRLIAQIEAREAIV